MSFLDADAHVRAVMPDDEHQFALALPALRSIARFFSRVEVSLGKRTRRTTLRLAPEVSPTLSDDVVLAFDLSLPPDSPALPPVGWRVSFNRNNFPRCNVRVAPTPGDPLETRVSALRALGVPASPPASDALRREGTTLAARYGLYKGRALVVDDTDSKRAAAALYERLGTRSLIISTNPNASGATFVGDDYSVIAMLSCTELFVGRRGLLSGFAALFGVPSVIPADTPVPRTLRSAPLKRNVGEAVEALLP